jgi:hypothetical protein
MNDPRHGFPLKSRVLVLCAFVACLVILPGSALAIATYDVSIFGTLTPSELVAIPEDPGIKFVPIPEGVTGIDRVLGQFNFTFSPPVTSTVKIGSNSNATSGGAGDAEVHGMASGPPVAVAASFESRVGQVALFNQNAGPVQLGLRAFGSPPSLNFTDASATGPNESASAHSRFQVFLDGNSLLLEERTFRSGDPFDPTCAPFASPSEGQDNLVRAYAVTLI